MVWTTIKNWVSGENLTHINFNEQMQQNMRHILEGNIRTVEVRQGITDPISLAANGWLPIDPIVQYVKINTTGAHIEIALSISIYNSGVSGYTDLDILVKPAGEPSFFLSSLTQTPTGLWREQAGSNYTRTRSYRFLWEFVDKKEYIIQAWWKANVGNNFANYTNTVSQFTVKEWGK